jgi:hypothetical protein
MVTYPHPKPGFLRNKEFAVYRGLIVAGDADAKDQAREKHVKAGLPVEDAMFKVLELRPILNPRFMPESAA